MTKCDICDKEGTIITQTFSAESKLDPINLCRTCQGKLILSLPKNASADQIRSAINKLYERVEEEKKHKHPKKW